MHSMYHLKYIAYAFKFHCILNMSVCRGKSIAAVNNSRMLVVVVGNFIVIEEINKCKTDC